MSYILREAINLFAMAKRYVCEGAFPGTEYTAADMIDQVMKTKLLLSSDFMQTLKGNWLIQRIPPLGDAIEITDGSLKWIDESTELGETMAEQRPAIWAKFVDAPYEAPPITNYVFGCPTREEVPNGLEAALCAARKMDPDTNIMDQITRSIKDILSGCISRPLASEGPSPSCPASATTKTTWPQSDHPAPASKHTPDAEPVAKPPVALVLEDSAQGGRGMGVDIPALATSAPSTSILPLPGLTTSPESGVKRKRPNPRPKPQAMGLPEPQVIELTPVVVPTPVLLTGGSEPRPLTPVDMVEGTQAMDASPTEDNAPSAEPSSSSIPADPLLPTATRSLRSKDKLKPKDPLPSPPPPLLPPPAQPTTKPESRQPRKRKSPPETETEKGQEKRTSARLQTRSGPEKVIPKSKDGKGERRVSMRLKHNH
ncbi:hypothetical protein FRC11_013729 [Ceratobasidium sp. 423]|nr:hypothetical protein FRC11_013729 [Ceratobasidium sp. 423]